MQTGHKLTPIFCTRCGLAGHKANQCPRAGGGGPGSAGQQQQQLADANQMSGVVVLGGAGGSFSGAASAAASKVGRSLNEDADRQAPRREREAVWLVA